MPNPNVTSIQTPEWLVTLRASSRFVNPACEPRNKSSNQPRECEIPPETIGAFATVGSKSSGRALTHVPLVLPSVGREMLDTTVALTVEHRREQ